MQFTAEQLADIVSNLSAAADSGGKPEQRRAPRVLRQARLSITPVVDGAEQLPFNVHLRDISSRGMAIMHAQPIPAGSQLVVRLPHEDNAPPVDILCTVVHCRPIGKQLFQVGCEFTCLAQRRAPAASGAGEQDRIRHSMLD